MRDHEGGANELAVHRVEDHRAPAVARVVVQDLGRDRVRDRVRVRVRVRGRGRGRVRIRVRVVVQDLVRVAEHPTAHLVRGRGDG